jgi:hypothetical protein
MSKLRVWIVVKDKSRDSGQRHHRWSSIELLYRKGITTLGPRQHLWLVDAQLRDTPSPYLRGQATTSLLLAIRAAQVNRSQALRNGRESK